MNTKLFDYILNMKDYSFIEFLSKITSKDNYWDIVRDRCKHITSDSTIKRYQCYAEMRYEEL